MRGAKRSTGTISSYAFIFYGALRARGRKNATSGARRFTGTISPEAAITN
jgi:hypothetical protein